jgi:hypothetical protein
MDAFCFTMAVFGFWVLLGRAVLSLCPQGSLPALLGVFLSMKAKNLTAKGKRK